MKISRRGFLSATALWGASYAERSAAFTQKIRDQRYAICQGATDSSSTTISALVPNNAEYDVIVTGSQGERIQQVALAVHQRDHSDSKLLQLTITGLQPGRDYQLAIARSDSSYVERRFFQSLNLKSEKVRIALASCMNDHIHSARVWQSMERQKPDAIFFLGDAVYADHPSLFDRRTADPRQMWERFVEAWSTLDFYKWPSLKPVFATWDDHDYGSNNSNRKYPHKEYAAEHFKAFYGQLPDTTSFLKGPGISYELKAFGQQFLFLDGRTFRSEARASEQTFFGREQENWLLQKLSEGSGPAWIVSGSQWFGGYLEKESYEYSHGDSFEWMLEQLAEVTRNISFVSGDVHFSEVMAIEESLLGYPTLEVTASSIHSPTVPGWHRLFSNPRRLRSTGRHNFLALDLELTPGGGQQETIRSFGKGRRALFTVTRRIDSQGRVEIES
ncbi:MAG: alkaline phosphatase D family protein [Bdellovibrionales bacterium]|nr:alkaline phosphatase D family protein [Bdellovibrionales bacterium]